MQLHRVIGKHRRHILSSRLTALAVLLAFTSVPLMSTMACAKSVAETDSSHKIIIAVDGTEWEFVSTASTVKGALAEAGVQVDGNDIVSPSLKKKTTDGMKIQVSRITLKIVTQKEPIQYRTIKRYVPSVTSDNQVIRKGQKGEKEVNYLITHKDGVKVSTKVDSCKVTKKPVHEILAVRAAQRTMALSSRSGTYYGGYNRRLLMVATAYDPSPRCCGPRATGRTANGMRAGYGVVAVDPRVIPLGTRLYVEGYGSCIAADTGGAIKGNRIDLCFNSYGEAVRFGRRTVTVYILGR